MLSSILSLLIASLLACTNSAQQPFRDDFRPQLPPETFLKQRDYAEIEQFKNIHTIFNEFRSEFRNVSDACGRDMAYILGTAFHPDHKQMLKLFIDYIGKPQADGTSSAIGTQIMYIGAYASCHQKFIFPRRQGVLICNGTTPPCDVVDYDEISGHYCSINSKLLISLGACFPRTCSEGDIEEMVVQAISEAPNVPTAVAGFVRDVTCIEHGAPPPEEWPTSFIVGIAVYGATLLSAIIGTITHYVTDAGKKYPDSFLVRVLMCFSFPLNSSKIWNVTSPDSPKAISCIHGIRVLSLLWVTYGHTLSFGFPYFTNFPDMYLFPPYKSSYQFMMRADLSVDSFFLISGLLVAYLTLPEVKKLKCESIKAGQSFWKKMLSFWAYYYIHRYLRLAVLLGFFIATCFTLPYMFPFKSPLWFGPISLMGEVLNACETRWWSTMLFINNMVDVDKTDCMPHCWYTAVDMQCYWVMPFFLIAMVYAPSLSAVLIAFTFIQTAFSGFITSMQEGYQFNMLKGGPNLTGQVTYYNRTWNRIGCYLVGIVVGAIMSKGKRKMGRFTGLIGWICCLILGAVLIWSAYPENMGWWENPPWVVSTYLALARIAWGCVLAWVIVACHWGCGGYINTLLSHPVWKPLSRLNYAAFIIHAPVILYFYESQMQQIIFFDTTLVYAFITVTVMTYALSHFASALWEAPFIALEKLVMTRGSTTTMSRKTK